MIKTVNITATRPILSFHVPIRGTISNVKLSTEDILKVICQKGIVDEILEDGTIIRLSMSNYAKDNSHLSKTYAKKMKEQKEREAEEAARLLKEAEEKARAEEAAREEERIRKEAERKAMEEAVKAMEEVARKQAEEKAKRDAIIAEKRAAIERAKKQKEQESNEEKK